MASKSAASSTSSLPEISRAKPSLVEAARKTMRSPPSLLAGDSELDVRAESSGAAVLGRRASGGDPQTTGWILKAATVPLVPRPPSPRGQPVARRVSIGVSMQDLLATLLFCHGSCSTSVWLGANWTTRNRPLPQ